MSAELTKGHAPDLIKHGEKHGLLRNEMAYVLATSDWETAHTHKPVKEAYWLDESWRRNHLRYYPWYGRGFVQLTWEVNYKRAQEELGLGTMLTDDPDKALDPEIACDIIIKGMIEGWFTGKKLSDYITLQRSDFVGARRIINGTDRAVEIASLAEDYDELLLMDKYGVDEPEEPAPTPPDTDPELDAEQVKRLFKSVNKMLLMLDERVDELERWRKS